MKNKAFTLIELLVVVLIIGILAAIAVPQYQKAVLKADIHRGVSLVESLYQAQQAYYLQHGDFAADIDELDISIPKDSSCEKKTNAYDCDYGRLYNNSYNIQFQNKPNKNGVSLGDMAYVHYFRDNADYKAKAGDRYCYAKKDNEKAKDVCQEIGGKEIDGTSSKWTYYKIQ